MSEISKPVLVRLLSKIFSFRIVNHYIVSLNSLNTTSKRNLYVPLKFEHEIIGVYRNLRSVYEDKIVNCFGESKLSSIKYRFSLRHHMVISAVGNDLASFCFFADAPFRFTNFRLKEKELYFYDCFTFPEHRGRSAIFSEVDYVLQYYQTLGYKRAHVEIEDTNDPSKKAFLKLGFELARRYYCIGILSFCIKA